MFYYVDNKLYVLDFVEDVLTQGELLENEVFDIGYMSRDSIPYQLGMKIQFMQKVDYRYGI